MEGDDVRALGARRLEDAGPERRGRRHRVRDERERGRGVPKVGERRGTALAGAEVLLEGRAIVVVERIERVGGDELVKVGFGHAGCAMSVPWRFVELVNTVQTASGRPARPASRSTSASVGGPTSRRLYVTRTAGFSRWISRRRSIGVPIRTRSASARVDGLSRSSRDLLVAVPHGRKHRADVGTRSNVSRDRADRERSRVDDLGGAVRAGGDDAGAELHLAVRERRTVLDHQHPLAATRSGSPSIVDQELAARRSRRRG